MPTVLVVDDSDVDRRLVSGLLKRTPGYDVRLACDGLQAIEMVRRDPPDLIVTDLLMPHMDGLELVASIVGEFPLIPVILMTGKGSESIAVRALREGAASYVPKSALADLLAETVYHVLEVAREDRVSAELMNCMKQNHSVFEFGNDDSLIPPLINFVQRCVRAVGLCDEATSIRVSVALEEALTNALFHGNLEISSELRDEDAYGYRRLIDRRRIELPYRDRKIQFDARVSREKALFIIRDQGPGFDRDGLPDPTHPANLEKPSGRGLLLMRTFMDQVEFNDAGNEVRMVKVKSES